MSSKEAPEADGSDPYPEELRGRLVIILDFDPSKYTGWAVYDTSKHLSAIDCGVFDIPQKADAYYTGDQISLRTKELIRKIGHKSIDFAVLEEQAFTQIGRSSAAGIIFPWVSTTSIVSNLANFGIPYGTLPPGTWRKMFFGKGFKPPKDNKDKNDWKAAASINASGRVSPYHLKKPFPTMRLKPSQLRFAGVRQRFMLVAITRLS